MVGIVCGIKVYFNGEYIKFKDFKFYCDFYVRLIVKERSFEEGGELMCMVEIDKDKGYFCWEVGFVVLDGIFQ